MITNAHLWLLTLSRFQGFQVHIPFAPHEGHVREFNSMLDGFQESSRGDFSPFRIKESEMNAPVPVVTGFEPVMPGYKYCDPAIFKARVAGAVKYIMMVTAINSGDPSFLDKKETKGPKSPPSQPAGIYIQNMHGSQLIAGSPHASITIKDSFNPKDQKFRELIKSIKDNAPKLGLEAESLNQLNADVATIEAQIESPAPKYTVIGESASSIRAVLESVAGSVLAQGLLTGLGYFFS